MKTVISVATTPTELAAADKNRFWTVIQNNSDTDFAIDLAGDGDALTMANGIVLAAGREICLVGAPANNRITAIHGSTGTKDCRVQGGSDK
jgi:hypothetical protein